MSAVLSFIRQGKQKSACKSYCKLSWPSHGKWVNTAHVIHNPALRGDGKHVPLWVLKTKPCCVRVGRAVFTQVHQCCFFLSYMLMVIVQHHAEQSQNLFAEKSLFAKAPPCHDPNSQPPLGDTGTVAIKRNFQWLLLWAVAIQEYHNKATFLFPVGFSWSSEFNLLHCALFGTSKMTLITQAVRNVGAVGLAAGCGIMTLSCPLPASPLSAEITISAMRKIPAGHKGDSETCPLVYLKTSNSEKSQSGKQWPVPFQVLSLALASPCQGSLGWWWVQRQLGHPTGCKIVKWLNFIFR